MSCLKPSHAASTFFFSTLLLRLPPLLISIFQKSTTQWNEKPCRRFWLERRDGRDSHRKTPTAICFVRFGATLPVGTDGVLIVDDQLPELVDKIKAAIAELGSGDIDYVVNTHWHFDHADGNTALCPMGDHISHDNARSDMADGGIINMVVAQYHQAPYPEAAPELTYRRRCLYTSTEGRLSYDTFLMHIPMAIRRCFSKTQRCAPWDVFIKSGHRSPMECGGIDGAIRFCEETLAQIDENTVVIPGHGRNDIARLKQYLVMPAQQTASGMIDEGRTSRTLPRLQSQRFRCHLRPGISFTGIEPRLMT